MQVFISKCKKTYDFLSKYIIYDKFIGSYIAINYNFTKSLVNLSNEMNLFVIHIEMIMRNISKFNSLIKSWKSCKKSSFYIEAIIVTSHSLFLNERRDLSSWANGKNWWMYIVMDETKFNICVRNSIHSTHTYFCFRTLILKSYELN